MKERLIVDSPVGRLRLVAEGGALVELAFLSEDPSDSGAAAGEQALGDTVRRAARQLDEYFAGARTTFDLSLAGSGTEWERRVWASLVEVPYGQTASYADVARRVGSPKAMRAVGRANGRNPIAIVVPCHRIIGAKGALVGYGGGLPRKEWLLAHERRVSASS